MQKERERERERREREREREREIMLHIKLLLKSRFWTWYKWQQLLATLLVSSYLFIYLFIYCEVFSSHILLANKNLRKMNWLRIWKIGYYLDCYRIWDYRTCRFDSYIKYQNNYEYQMTNISFVSFSFDFHSNVQSSEVFVFWYFFVGISLQTLFTSIFREFVSIVLFLFTDTFSFSEWKKKCKGSVSQEKSALWKYQQFSMKDLRK